MELDDNPNAGSIAAGGHLYEQHSNDLSIWQYTGVPCNRNGCTGWREIDNSGLTMPLGMVAGANTVYQLEYNPNVPEGRAIFEYTGTPCNGRVCSGWEQLDNNANTLAIVAGGQMFGF